jgi:hypothetical protein
MRDGSIRQESVDNPHEEDTMTAHDRDQVPQSELDRYGIERVPADVFLWGGYRYSNARDAIAAARRSGK